MSARYLRCGAALLGLVVAGCSTVPVPPPVVSTPERVQKKPALPPPETRVEVEPEPMPEKPVTVPQASDLELALNYFGALRNASASDLRREYDAARQSYAQSPTELNRVRLALVLSMPGNAQKDEKRALELLDPLAKTTRSEHAPLRAFALVVQTFVREQLRLGGNAQALKEKLDALMSLEKSLAGRERGSPGGVK